MIGLNFGVRYELWGQSKITPNPALDRDNEDFTLTPAIIGLISGDGF